MLHQKIARAKKLYVTPLLTPSEAVKLAARIFGQNGFLTIRKSKASYYMKRKDSNFLIRISDHSMNKGLSKIHYDLVFDYDTIKVDVEQRSKMLVRKFTLCTVK